jgi:purine-binding chemotaxis protein CheW
MADEKEFLTFKISDETFAVEIMRVQEIRGWESPNPLPNVPKFVKGVVDLRGEIVPIIDLRQRFNLKVDYSSTTVVIVVKVKSIVSERVVGLVVDAVSDVKTINLDSLQQTPEISSNVGDDFMMGLTRISDAEKRSQSENATNNPEDGLMVIILDIDKLVSESLLDELNQKMDGKIQA